MRVCDWIAQYLYDQGVTRVHGLMGGGASGLNDGFIRQGQIDYICYHHEQGAGHAAIGESKYTGKIAVVNPTTGCAGTNCATSVLNAWQDSVPVLFLSGNVRSSTCSGPINARKGINIRKYGIQEHHVIETYRSMTKMVYFIQRPEQVAFYLQMAMHTATSGRPGPVWLDIPGDVQTAQMPEKFNQHDATGDLLQMATYTTKPDYSAIRHAIEQAERPVVLAGYGIRQSNTVSEFVNFVEGYQIPYVSTYGARDYTAHDHPLNIGAVGIKGSRAGNFAMQNADLLLVLGSSLGASVIGYDPDQFSPASYKIVVDVDNNEMFKDIVKIDSKAFCSLSEFFRGML